MKRHRELKRIFRSAIHLTLAVFAILGLIDPVRSWASDGSDQNPRKSIEEAFAFKPQVRISKIKTGEIERELKKEFEDSQDWLKRLSIEVESVAAKPIVYIELNLNFPETRASGNLMSFPIRVGVRPDLNVPRDNKPFRLLPNEKVTILVADQYDHLVQFVERRNPMRTINKIQLEIGFIIFEDGTAWHGDFMKPDPSKPGRYIPAKLEKTN